MSDTRHAAENRMTPDHKPEPWFWECEESECPSGPEPDDMTPEWDAWSDRHQGSPQGVRICLDTPAGEACGVCSEDDGEMVPWSACRARKHARPKGGMVPTPDAVHEPVTVLVGTLECHDRECDEYFTEDGDADPGVERCSHIREEQACSCQRGPDGEYDGEPCPALVAA